MQNDPKSSENKESLKTVIKICKYFYKEYIRVVDNSDQAGNRIEELNNIQTELRRELDEVKCTNQIM